MNGIEELLKKYGTSLEETRKLMPELVESIKRERAIRPPIVPTTPQFFTAEEVRGMGLVTEAGEPFEIEPGWRMKVTPPVNGQEPIISYITPEDWEITQDQMYVSPEGQRFTREQMETQLAAPEVPLEVEQVFGKVFPERDVADVLAYVEAQPEAFYRDIMAIGRTEETEVFLKTIFPEITPEQIEQFFTPPAPEALEIPEEGIGFMLTVEEKGVEVRKLATLLPDNSVWIEGQNIGRYDPVTELITPRAVADIDQAAIQAWDETPWGAGFAPWDEAVDGFPGPIDLLRWIAPTKAGRALGVAGAHWQKYISRPWETFILETRITCQTFYGLDTEADRWAQARLDEARDKYGLAMYFSPEVSNVYEAYVKESWLPVEVALRVSEWCHPVYWLPVGKGAGVVARYTSRIPIIGKITARTAAAVTKAEMAIAYPLTKPMQVAYRKTFGAAIKNSLRQWGASRGVTFPSATQNQVSKIILSRVPPNKLTGMVIKDLFTKSGSATAAAQAATTYAEKQAVKYFPLLTASSQAVTGATPATSTAIVAVTEKIISANIPTASITAGLIASFVPKGITLEKTVSLTAQLGEMGFAEDAIAAMSTEEAWANLFKTAAPEVIVPPPKVPGVDISGMTDGEAAKIIAASDHLLMEIPSQADIITSALQSNWGKTLAEEIGKIPAGRELIKIIDPRELVSMDAATIEAIVARNAIGFAEVVKMGQNAAAVKMGELQGITTNPVKMFGFNKDAYSAKMISRLLPDYKGTVEAGTLEHVFTHPEMYSWEGFDKGLRYVTTVHEINTEVFNLLKKEGVAPALSEEAMREWWIHRVVEGRYDADGELIAIRGRLGMRGVTAAKRGYEMHRKAPTMFEGMSWHIKYAENPEVSVRTYIEDAFIKMAQERFYQGTDTALESLGKAGVKPSDVLKELYPDIIGRFELAADELKAAASFHSVINRAIRGERTPEQTLSAIERRFPELGKRFRALVKEPIVADTQLRAILAQNEKLIKSLRAKLERAEAIDIEAIKAEARTDAIARGIPDEQKLVEAFRLMEYEDRLAFRSTMESQMEDIGQMLAEEETELAGILEFLKTDPVATYRGHIGEREVSLMALLKKGQFPESFTVKEATMLMMGRTPKTIIKGRVPRSVVVDELADHFGMEEQRLIDHIESIAEQRVTAEDLRTLVTFGNNRATGIKRMLEIMDKVDTAPEFILKVEPAIQAEMAVPEVAAPEVAAPEVAAPEVTKLSKEARDLLASWLGTQAVEGQPVAVFARAIPDTYAAKLESELIGSGLIEFVNEGRSLRVKPSLVSEANLVAKGKPAIPKVPSIEEPWTMSASTYQAKMGVHEPWIAEISPSQYAGLSKRAKVEYDKKRAIEWQASADIKGEWRDKVLTAYQEGRITLETPGLSEEAKSAITLGRIREREVAAEQALKDALERNRIKSVDDVKVGDRVHDVMIRQYGTITKKFKNSVRLKLDEPLRIRGKPTTEITVNARALEWQSYNDVKASVEAAIKEAPVIPKAAPGMPEAGLQKDIFGYETPHFPRGKGEVTQISMDDYNKLVEYHKQQGLPPPDVGVRPVVEGIKGLEPEVSAVPEAVLTADEVRNLGNDIPAKYNDASFRLETRTIAEFSPTDPFDARATDFAEAIRRGEKLPPIVIEESGIVIDGNQRLGGYEQAGVKNIPVAVVVEPKPPAVEVQAQFKKVTYEAPPVKSVSERNAALDALRKEVKVLTEAKKVPYWKARAERAAKMELVRQPPIGEGFIMQSHFSGKIYDQEFIDAVNAFFGHKSGLRILKPIADLSGILTTAKAALDVSFPAIQGMPAFGLAHSYFLTNPKIGAKLLGAWFKAFAYPVRAYLQPEWMHRIVAKNEADALQRISFGGSSMSIDYFRALRARGGLGGFAAEIMHKIPFTPYERAELAFYGAGEIIRNEFWNILKDNAFKQGAEFNLAQALDRMTGLISSEKMGITLTQRQLERSFMFFAPQYTRACLTFLGNVFRGGYTGAHARRALGGLIAAGAMYYAAVQYAIATLEGKDHDDAWDTVLEGYGLVKDPITGDWEWRPTARFMSIRVGNYNFGVGGFWYGLVRLAGNINACINEVGEKERIDLVRIFKDGSFNRRDNPFLYWWWSRSSMVTHGIAELGSGTDFLGYPIETPWEYSRYLIEMLQPIWMEQGVNWMIPGMAKDNEVPEGAARQAIIPAELFGLRTFPESQWVKFYDKASEYIKHIPEDELDEKQLEAWRDGKLEWRHLTDIQQINLLSRYPELNEIYTGAQADSAVRDSDKWKQWQGRTDEEKTTYYDRGNNLIERLISGELDTREFREMWSEAGQNYGIALDTIEKEPTYSEIYDYFEKAQSERGEEYGFLDDLALGEYVEIMFTDYLDNKGDYDWDAKDIAVDEYIEKWGEETYGRIRQMYADKKELAGLSPALIRLSDDKDKLGREYWQLPYKPIREMDEDDEVEGNIPAEYYALWKQYQALETDAQRDAFIESNPLLAKDWRAEYRLNNPEDDARLALWGYGGKLQSMEAYDLVTKWAQELGIPLEQMGLGLPPRSLIDQYFEHAEIVKETSGSSVEARLYKLEHPGWLDWGVENWGWGDLADDNINALRLRVEHKDLFAQYEGYGARHSETYIEDDKAREEARDKLLEANPIFRDDRRRVEAYQLEFPDDQIESYVEYSNLLVKGFEQERYLLEHAEFYQSMIDLKDMVPFDPGYKVPAVQYDQIYHKWEDLFEQYEAVTGTVSQRKAAREKILTANPEFAFDRQRREAYGKFVPEHLVDTYAEWFTTKPQRSDDPWFEEHPTETYYGDDWWLMDRMEFYDTMVAMGLWEERDFSKVPTKEVFALYKTYKGIPQGTPQYNYRARFPTLDAWGVLKFGWIPIGERGKKEVPKTPWEEAEEAKRFKELF